MQMHQFVDDHVIDEVLLQQDQVPVEVDVPQGAATSPFAFQVLDHDPFNGYLGSLRPVRHLSVQIDFCKFPERKVQDLFLVSTDHVGWGMNPKRAVRVEFEIGPVVGDELNFRVFPKQHDSPFHVGEQLLFSVIRISTDAESSQNPPRFGCKELFVEVTQFACSGLDLKEIALGERNTDTVRAPFEEQDGDGLVANPELFVFFRDDHDANLMVNRNVAPFPGSLSTQMRSWWASMRCLQIAKPNPVPPLSRERLLSTR